MKKFKTLTETHQDIKRQEYNQYLLSTLTPREQERYTIIPDMEGPIKLRSGKIVYYDQAEGKYYDRDSDMFMSIDDIQLHSESTMLLESITTVNEGYSEHLQQLVKDIRAEDRDNMVIHMLGEFGAMMAERGYERAKVDFGVGNA